MTKSLAFYLIFAPFPEHPPEITMTREYNYSWKPLVVWIIAVLFLVGLMYWRTDGDLVPVTIIGLIGLFLVILIAWPLCKVELTINGIEIKYLLPFRRGGEFRHEDIERYTETKLNLLGKRIVLGGALQIVDKSKVILLPSGTQSFGELSRALRKVYFRRTA